MERLGRVRTFAEPVDQLVNEPVSGKRYQGVVARDVELLRDIDGMELLRRHCDPAFRVSLTAVVSRSGGTRL